MSSCRKRKSYDDEEVADKVSVRVKEAVEEVEVAPDFGEVTHDSKLSVAYCHVKLEVLNINLAEEDPLLVDVKPEIQVETVEDPHVGRTES
jgi:hypothetical protein